MDTCASLRGLYPASLVAILRLIERQRRTIVVIACLSMVSFGIVLTTLGATLPNIISRFGIDKREAGALLSLMSFTVLIGSFVFGPIVDRRGYRAILLFSFAAIVIGLETIAFAPSIGWLRAGVALIGFTGALVNGAANALVVDVSPGRRAAALAFMSSFFGVGAAGVPVILASLAGDASYATMLAVIGLFVVIPFVLTARAAFPPEKQPHGFPLGEARALLRDPLLLLLGLMMFLESGMEITVGGWTTTFFVEELNVSIDRAPIYLAVFWLGLTLTRLTLGLFMTDAARARVLLAAVATALASALWLVSTRSVPAAAVAAFLLGCGFAPVFPVILGFIGDRYARLSGTALSIGIGIALAGGMVTPYAIGVLANEYGLRSSFMIVPASLVCLGLLLGILWRQFASVQSEGTE